MSFKVFLRIFEFKSTRNFIRHHIKVFRATRRNIVPKLGCVFSFAKHHFDFLIFFADYACDFCHNFFDILNFTLKTKLLWTLVTGWSLEPVQALTIISNHQTPHIGKGTTIFCRDRTISSTTLRQLEPSTSKYRHVMLWIRRLITQQRFEAVKMEATRSGRIELSVIFHHPVILVTVSAFIPAPYPDHDFSGLSKTWAFRSWYPSRRRDLSQFGPTLKPRVSSTFSSPSFASETTNSLSAKRRQRRTLNWRYRSMLTINLLIMETGACSALDSISTNVPPGPNLILNKIPVHFVIPMITAPVLASASDEVLPIFALENVSHLTFQPVTIIDNHIFYLDNFHIQTTTYDHGSDFSNIRTPQNELKSKIDLFRLSRCGSTSNLEVPDNLEILLLSQSLIGETGSFS